MFLADLAACREMECPSCGAVGLTAPAYHRGRQTVIVGTCQTCGAETEL
jgi:hypothetical protein